MSQAHAVFLVNLLQDVNVIRPLVFMTARDLSMPTLLLVSRYFHKRDVQGTWKAELDELAAATGAKVISYQEDYEVLQHLQGKYGALVAGSESNLNAHLPTHSIFKLAPPSFVRITLQHGFECVGFRNSRDHDIAHGRRVRFASDIVCSWTDGAKLNAATPSTRSKLYVAGPPTILQMRRRTAEAKTSGVGIVCENLHSVRLNMAGDFKVEFIDIFGDFCEALARDGREVVLRPHPGGQYVLKNSVPLPENVTLNNNPIYKVDLTRFAYGISAPSSVVIDMVLAGIPTAVWRDGAGTMDAGNYDGLTEISSLSDWVDFSKEASAHPDRFLERQDAFLQAQQMLLDPEEIYRRYARLFQAIGRSQVSARTVPERERILFVANGPLPTLQLSFLKPLAPRIQSGEIAVDFITFEDLKAQFGRRLDPDDVKPWLTSKIERFRPTLLLFCRYSGAFYDHMLDVARRKDVPVIYHIDDDLLNIPIEIGVEKFKSHNRHEKLAAVRYLLEHADLVYCSTARLRERFRSLGIYSRMIAGKIYCAGSTLRVAQDRPVRKVGYMGFDHAHDLALVLPALVAFLRRNPDIQFELFGSIPKPAELDEFGSRVTTVAPVRGYEAFLRKFAERDWDIGICPLADTDFNFVKANTKWVEYTAVGAAVIASKGTIYDDCCSDGCGLLATSDDEWIDALERLIRDPAERFRMVRRAQQRLEEDYSEGRLQEQVLKVFAQAKEKVGPVRRILFIANDFIPTLQLSFVKPLRALVEDGTIVTDFLTVGQMKERARAAGSQKVRHADWVKQRLEAFSPTLVVFCRYNGPHADLVLDWASRHDVPALYHIDDDLLNIPADIGTQKVAVHNRPERLETVRTLLSSSALIYCSTDRLRRRLVDLGFVTPMVAGKIYCSGEVLNASEDRAVRKIGYMAGSGHEHDFLSILPAVVTFLDRHPEVYFELFGSITLPKDLERFGERVRVVPPIGNYDNFLTEFGKLGWDIGLCPLTPIPFNLMKANTKWVEYTAIGAAVIASRGTVYDECCADDCGILAETAEDWLAAMERLTGDPHERFRMVKNAQQRLEADYRLERLREQVLDIFDLAGRDSPAQAAQ